MKLQELYKYYGTWTNLARALDIGNSTYQVWRKKGFIPLKSQLLIEHKTKGLFKSNEKHAKPGPEFKSDPCEIISA
jgi:hypothetical protein